MQEKARKMVKKNPHIFIVLTSGIVLVVISTVTLLSLLDRVDLLTVNKISFILLFTYLTAIMGYAFSKLIRER